MPKDSRQLLHDDGGGGHGDRAAEHDGDRGGRTEPPGHAAERGGGQADLRAAEREDLVAHGEHARQRELEPEGEQQEDDAELRQRAGRLGVLDPTERVRAESGAHGQEAEHRRQAEPAQGGHDQQGRCQQHQHVGKHAVRHPPSPRDL